MKTYYLGCTAVGVTTGFLVGASSSPVVQYVLPLLFSILGAATTLLSLTMRSDSSEARERFRVVGASLLALMLPFFVSATYAALVRTNRSLADLIPHLTAPPSPVLIDPEQSAMLSPDDAIRVLVIDRKLHFLGINDREIDKIRNEIVARLADSNRHISENRTILQSLTAELETDLNSQLGEGSLDGQILKLTTEFANYRLGTKSPKSNPSDIERNALVGIRSASRDILDSSTELTKTVRSNASIMANFTKLTALLVPIEGTSIIDDSAKEELSSGLEQVAKGASNAKAQQQGFFAVND